MSEKVSSWERKWTFNGRGYYFPGTHSPKSHSLVPPMECELSFSTGTFLNNYDVTDIKLKPLLTYSTVGKWEENTMVETTTFSQVRNNPLQCTLNIGHMKKDKWNPDFLSLFWTLFKIWSCFKTFWQVTWLSTVQILILRWA